MKPCAIITGASSGIGAAIARAFGENGYDLVLAGRDEARLSTASGSLSAASWVGDLGQSKACDALISFAISRYGRIDVLVNCAGVIFREPTPETSDSHWRETMSINLDAPFFLSRAALPHLVKSKGAIINIASDWGLEGGKNAAAYCASKGGLVLLTRAMALDHAKDGLRINTICPGDVDTPMLEYEADQRGLDYDTAMQENHAESPTGRVTRPDEVASLALYLASPQAAQITGAAIPIDGGNTA